MTKFYFSSHLPQTISSSLHQILDINDQEIALGKAQVTDSEQVSLTDFLKTQTDFIVIGCDEVGRGCIFGPVVGAASCIGKVDYAFAQLVQKTAKANSAKAREKALHDLKTNQANALTLNYNLNSSLSDSSLTHSLTSTPVNPYYQALNLQLDLKNSALIEYALKDVDSKKLTETKRQVLMDNFLQQAYNLDVFLVPSISLDFYHTLSLTEFEQYNLTPIQYVLMHNFADLKTCYQQLGEKVVLDNVNIFKQDEINSNWIGLVDEVSPLLYSKTKKLQQFINSQINHNYQTSFNSNHLQQNHLAYYQTYAEIVTTHQAYLQQLFQTHNCSLDSNFDKILYNSSLNLGSDISTNNSHILLSVMQASTRYIDQYNILKASLDVMTNAVLEVIKQLQQKAQTQGVDFADLIPRILVLVDGNQILPYLIPLGISQIAIVKGDSRVREISVASITAKVYRDDLITYLAQQPNYASYGLAQHKGYPTAEHLRCLASYGVTDQHRKSYVPVANLLNDSQD